jgi:hypothetical protein
LARINSEAGIINYTKVSVLESLPEEKNAGKNITFVSRSTVDIRQRIEHENGKSSIEGQRNELSVGEHSTGNSSETLTIKGRVLHKQTTDNQSINNTRKLSSTGLDGDAKLTTEGNVQVDSMLNNTKNRFTTLKNSKVETQQVLREIHRLKDEISSDYKSSSALQRKRSHKSEHSYQTVSNNNANQPTPERDLQAFQRIRNRLKNLGLSFNGFIIPTNNQGFNFNDVADSDATSRPDVCTGCFEKNFNKIINEPSLCDGDVELLFMIASTFSRKDSRNAIRNTWCGQCNKSDSKMKVVFVFGNRNDSVENANLLNESKKYRDILQFDFNDTYANLTYKTITSLQWSDDYCKKANYVMKTDDDMYVNTELLPLMLKAAPSKHFMGGMCWGPSSPHRDMNSKWYVSFVQYRHALFPSMCSGTGYVMSRDVVSGILQESPNVPFFYLEDVYVAICLKRFGVTPLLLDGFNNQHVEFDPCSYRNRIITAHELSADSLVYIWNESRTCPKADTRPEMVYRPFPV